MVFRVWLMLALCLLVGSSPMAGELGPAVPKASHGEKCVAPTADMRINHMNYLNHQRDGTVREGVRTSQYSLVGCLGCHATTGDDGQFLRVSESGHFCTACHEYAAVTIDCFQCHADRPEAPRHE